MNSASWAIMMAGLAIMAAFARSWILVQRNISRGSSVKTTAEMFFWTGTASVVLVIGLFYARCGSYN